MVVLQAAKTEATEALSKETLVRRRMHAEHVTRHTSRVTHHTSHVTLQIRSKLDLLCKELQKRNLELKIQVARGDASLRVTRHTSHVTPHP